MLFREIILLLKNEETKWATDFISSNNKKRGKRRMAWTDEKKAQAIEAYQDAEPTPETSMEIVKEIAEDLGESPNGVRMILTKAGVYVKKQPLQRMVVGLPQVVHASLSKLHKMH